MKDSTIVFLQKDYWYLPAGTPLIRCAPSAAHIQAAATVGGDEPSGYYHLPGSPDRVVRIPFVNDLVGETHPQAKEVIGPFVPGKVIAVYDTISSKKAVVVVFEKDWPYVNAIMVVNIAERDPNASVTIDPLPNCIGGELFLDRIKTLIKEL